MKQLCLLVVILFGTGACSSTVAVVDVAATTAVYTVDAITPDIIN